MNQLHGLVCDLDGTVYGGDAPIPGAIEFLNAFTARGGRVVYATNRANVAPDRVAAKLRGFGLACEEEQVLTSGLALAQELGARSVFCLGEAPLRDALERHGATWDDRAPEAVVVGYDRELDYARLAHATRLILGGAAFWATNRDAFIWHNGVRLPENGPAVAYLETATGVAPRVAGKPEAPLFRHALVRLGLPREQVAVLGDNLATDILGARRAGLRSILVLTGVTSAADLVRAGGAGAPDGPTVVAADYAALRALWETEAAR